MSREEIEEMATILMELGVDTYLKCKLMILANAKKHQPQETVDFFEKLFAITDERRPLLLEMRGGAA